MKTFNPIGISITLAFHLLIGGVLLFTQGCQSTPSSKPEAATPPPIISAAELGSQQRNRQWDDQRLSEPTRPSWATEPGVEVLPDDTVWNPIETVTADTPQLDELVWNDQPGARTQGADQPGALSSTEDTVPSRTYTVAAGDTLSRIASSEGVTLRELLEANNLSMSSVIRPGQELVIPGHTAGRADSTTGEPTSSRETASSAVTSSGAYTVKAGDSLSRIARQHGVSVAALKSANGLSGDMIRIGQELTIPGKTATSGAASPRGVASETRTSSTPATPGETITHKVVSGDMLSVIARRYGTSVEQIKRDNNIRDERRIQIGQELIIRKSTAASSEAPQTGTPARGTGTAGESLRDRVPATGSDIPPAPRPVPPAPAPAPTPDPEQPLFPDEDSDRDALERIISEGTANPIRD